MWQQTLITLRARPRGFHLVTDELLDALPELRQCRVGLLHLWLRHTSASLTINENADAAVRRDFERFFNRLVPQGEGGYEHDYEGPDDLPAHFKASLLGCQLSLPVSDGGWHSVPGRASISESTATRVARGRLWQRCTGRQVEFFLAVSVFPHRWAITYSALARP